MAGASTLRNVKDHSHGTTCFAFIYFDDADNKPAAILAVDHLVTQGRDHEFVREQEIKYRQLQTSPTVFLLSGSASQANSVANHIVSGVDSGNLQIPNTWGETVQVFKDKIKEIGNREKEVEFVVGGWEGHVPYVFSVFSERDYSLERTSFRTAATGSGAAFAGPYLNYLLQKLPLESIKPFTLNGKKVGIPQLSKEEAREITLKCMAFAGFHDPATGGAVVVFHSKGRIFKKEEEPISFEYLESKYPGDTLPPLSEVVEFERQIKINKRKRAADRAGEHVEKTKKPRC